MGSAPVRTQTLISEVDAEFLNSKDYSWEATAADGYIHLVIRDFPVPNGFRINQSNLLIRLPAGYPNSNPDMFWTHPDVFLTNGKYPPAADVHDVQYEGHSWQRWSRHFNGPSWRPGVDGIRTYLAVVRTELEKSGK